MNSQAQPIDLPNLDTEAGNTPVFKGRDSMPFVGQLKVRLTAQLGTAEISVAELMALRVGEPLKLDRLADAPIDIVVEGHVVAQGTLVAIDDHYGLRITSPANWA